MLTTNQNPLVSICVPCYNHAKYIPYFMESVLSQNYDNWELIITDDCSTDGSYELLTSYKDARVKIFKNDKNRHLCDTMNNSFRKAKGKYICIMYTDDAMCPNKIQKDVEYMESHVGIDILYTNTIRIDENNNIRKEQYNLSNMSNSNAILHDLFLNTNTCSIPGMFLKKECLEKVGLHNRLLCLTQDYEHHVRLLFHYKSALSPEPTCFYRIRDGEANLSHMNSKNVNMLYIETTFVLNAFIKEIKTTKKLLDIFPEAIQFGKPKDEFIPYFLGRIALTSKINSVQYFGLNLLYNFMQQRNNIELLEKQYDFLPKDFMSLVKAKYIFIQPPKEKKLHGWKKIKFKIKNFLRRT